MNTDLVIVGAGAAGLMAGAAAAESGLRAVLLERKHQPGRKLLMCGNNRCNLSHAGAVEDLIAAYGDPVGEFLAPALHSFCPDTLRNWFARHGLSTIVHKDGRVFPRSEKADDVLHFFTDMLRDNGVPMTLNCPVEGVRSEASAFVTSSSRLELRSPYLLIATGGVSYPKTGSVGDGQRFAKRMGHRIAPYRPGLAGIELAESWLYSRDNTSIQDVAVSIISDGQVIATSNGEVLCESRCVRGSAIVNTSRIVARKELREYVLEVDLCPGVPEPELSEELTERLGKRGIRDASAALSGWVLPNAVSRKFVRHVAPDLCTAKESPAAVAAAGIRELARTLKHWRLHPVKTRPLKEAMVTVGGVALEQIDPATMESRRCANLFFAGEVMDVDGPTGGYNLHAAFAGARLAVKSVAERVGKR